MRSYFFLNPGDVWGYGCRLAATCWRRWL